MLCWSHDPTLALLVKNNYYEKKAIIPPFWVFVSFLFVLAFEHVSDFECDFESDSDFES